MNILIFALFISMFRPMDTRQSNRWNNDFDFLSEFKKKEPVSNLTVIGAERGINQPSSS